MHFRKLKLWSLLQNPGGSQNSGGGPTGHRQKGLRPRISLALQATAYPGLMLGDAVGVPKAPVCRIPDFSGITLAFLTTVAWSLDACKPVTNNFRSQVRPESGHPRESGGPWFPHRRNLLVLLDSPVRGLPKRSQPEKRPRNHPPVIPVKGAFQTGLDQEKGHETAPRHSRENGNPEMQNWRNLLVLLDSRVRGNDGGGVGMWRQSKGNGTTLSFWKAQTGAANHSSSGSVFF